MLHKLTTLCASVFFVLLMGLHTYSIAGSERGPKKCSDNIDNDGDELIDEDDPDCGGEAGGGGPVVVVDSSDPPKQVGEIVATFDTGLAVAFDVDGRVIRLKLDRDGWGSLAILYYVSDDCGVAGEDDALHEASEFNIYAHAVIALPGNTVYVERPGAAIVNREVSSRRFRAEEGGECAIDVRTRDTIIVDPIVDLDTLFVPPFVVVGDAPTLP